MKNVVAYSYDIDSCLFLKTTPADAQGVVEYHEDRLFKAQKNELAKKYVFCGSSRQTPYHDNRVSSRHGDALATDLLSAIAVHINAIYNTFFFGDIVTYLEDDTHSFIRTFNKHSPGTLYSNRKDISKPMLAFAHYFKVDLIYAQICNLCIHEPDAENIVFNFYDDRLELLSAIESFFKRFPQLFLKNVTLNLWHYSECDHVFEPKLIASIQGTCEKPHQNYYAVIQKLIETRKIVPKYDASTGQKLLILRQHAIDATFINELVQLATNGQSSHQQGEGLIDNTKTCSQNTLVFSNRGQPDPNVRAPKKETSFHFF